jgi:hypothetical protein
MTFKNLFPLEAIPLYQNTKFSLHASNQETAQNVIVKEIDGVLLKITIHYLNLSRI